MAKNDFYQDKTSGLFLPKSSEYTGNNPWETRIEQATKFYDEWEGKFKCKLLSEYYEGFQWKQRRDYPTTNYNPYTLNLVFSTIKIKLSSFLFQRPKFLVSPTPGNSQWNLDFAVQSAQLKEDVLNTIVRNPNTNFTRHVKRAAKDSFFRFGVLEIGYAADWRNPQKVDPELQSWDDPNIQASEDRVVEDNSVPTNERFYVKRIPPHRFRVAVSDAIDLNDHDWYGYYDYYYTRTLMNTKGIDWPANYSGGDYVSSEFATGFVGAYGSNSEDIFKKLYTAGELSRVWHLWDNVKQERKLLLEDDEMHELWSGKFDYSPILDLRWDERDSGFYPIPPVFNWLSPQDEINEAREQVRSYRRRFTRKFQTVKGQVDEEEKEKFSSGPDGILVEVKIQDAIKPIDNPEIGPTSENALVLAKDDFNIVSGTSAEARGQNADRETATQAKIVDTRAQIRESAEQLDFSVWLAAVGRQFLLCAQSKLVEGMWVRMTQNPGAPVNPDGSAGPDAMMLNKPVYDYVSSQQLTDGFDYEVDFDVQNATPAAMQAAQQSFINLMALLAQFPMIAMSPVLIREAAYRVGYRNEQVIKEIQQTALAQAKMQAQQLANAPVNNVAGSGGGANPGKQALASPTSQQIQTQLTNQLQ